MIDLAEFTARMEFLGFVRTVYVVPPIPSSDTGVVSDPTVPIWELTCGVTKHRLIEDRSLYEPEVLEYLLAAVELELHSCPQCITRLALPQ